MSSSRRDNCPEPANYSAPRGSAGLAVQSTVARLIVSIKQLLESLKQWSEGHITEEGVSDVYVRLGNDFNAAVAAFSMFSIDMSELMSVPDDLRTVLEQCLSEDATPDNLEIYIPSVRQIMKRLLQGLKRKQTLYDRIISERKHQLGHEPTESRSLRGATHRSYPSHTTTEGQQPQEGDRQNGASSSGRREPPNQLESALPRMNRDSSMTPPTSQHRRQMSVSHRKNPSKEHSESHAPTQPSSSLPDTENTPAAATAVSPSANPSIPGGVKQDSPVDKLISPTASSATPTLVVEPSSPSVAQESPDHEPSCRNSYTAPPGMPPSNEPAIVNSLAALSNVLERRASKRFSTYHISKITGAGSPKEKPTRSRPKRRSFLANGSVPTSGDLAILTEVDDEGESLQPQIKSRDDRIKGNLESLSRTNPNHGRPLPPTPSKSAEPTAPDAGAEIAREAKAQMPPTPASPEPPTFPIFLQVGREVKKVVIEPGLTFSSLRVLFVDRFSYNPGQENFPAIYIRDPSSGVQYELEDMDEVKEKCLLSLNIEPLDQIKQHIDVQMSTLTQEMRELRTAMVSDIRHPITPTIFTQPLDEGIPVPNRPTDRQFQTVARRLSRLANHDPSPPLPTIPMIPQMTGQSLQSQMTGGSILSDYTSRVMTDLKTQFDEVQNLRRDLGIMRQLYTEFMKQTKESLGSLRSQTQSVKQLANTSVGGAREYINTGKKKLDIRSQDVLTEVEKLQDAVEGIKDDVLKKQVTPKAQHLKSIEKDIQAVASEIDSLKEHINTVKPMWKKTWEEELQNIVEEQQFLTHQEEFLGDLLEDHKALLEVYGHVQKVISLRASAPRMRGFRPPPAEEGQNGVNSLLREIRGASVDPERRIKAIEASQKSRKKEKTSRTNELHNELTEFVGQKGLRMTGGAEEAERVRQKRSEMALKAMFNEGGG